MLVNYNEMAKDEREVKEAEDFGYISCSIFLNGAQNQAKIEAKPEFEGYLRYMIRVTPDKIPALETDEAKELYKKLYAELTSKEMDEKMEFAPVIIPEYEKEIIAEEANSVKKDDKTVIDVEPEELKDAESSKEPEVSEPEPQEQQTPEPQATQEPQQTTQEQFWNPNIGYQPIFQQGMYQQPTQFQNTTQQAFETPINISDRPMLQMIRDASWSVGLETYFFQEPLNDLVKICYVATDGTNRRYLDDWLDPAGCYFPEPVIIPNKAVPILWQAIISINNETLRSYMCWKKNPMMNPQMNEYIVNYVPDRLLTDVCYSTHQIVKYLDAANTHILKTSLVSIFSFLDQNRPELTGIRWEFTTYESPDKFTLEPEEISPSTRGLIFHTSRQIMDVSVIFDNTAKEDKIKIVSKSVDSAQSAVDAKNALKASLNKGNPAQTKKPTKKQPATKKTNSKKKSDEEAADAETVAASK